MATSSAAGDGGPALAAVRSLPKELRNLVAGGLAGMLAKSFVAPIDRIKILYQVTSARFRLRDVPRVAYSIVEKEGWAALWKGNTATMIRVFPYSGIQFMVFDYCKVHFLGERKRKTYADVAGGQTAATTLSHRGTIAKRATISADGGKKGGLTPIESLVSGMMAGTVSVLFTYPLDLARAQLAVLRKQKKPPKIIEGCEASKLDAKLGIGHTKRSSSSKGIGYVLKHSFETGGARGLYRGITPTMLGILPYSGMAFTINEQAKRQVAHVMQREPTTVEKLQCGALSGLFAQTLAYPLEVTRRRMQTIGIVPTSGTESAAVNFSGVSDVKPCVDEMPPEEIQREFGGRRLNAAGNSSGVAVEAAGGTAEGAAQSVASSTATATPQQHHHKPPSMVTTMRHLFEEQGVRGFYKGVSMNWVKGPIAFSISFTAFDTIQGWIETEAEREKRSQLAKISIQRRLTNNESNE
ncbi:hypothetical protein ACHAXT_005909 [Thalassiosira profunda]